MNQAGEELRQLGVVAAIITRGESYLITQRRNTALLPLMWEFPGGRVEEPESDEAALKRVVRHRLGAEIDVQEEFKRISHRYERYQVNMHLYSCILRTTELTAVNVNNFAWAAPSELGGYLFTPADEACVAALR